MGQTEITLTGAGIQNSQTLDITISVEARIDIDAKTAQRQVTAWLVSEVGNMLIGGSPQLVIGKMTVWRVPVILTSSQVGTVGQVGTVDVDGITGELLVSDELCERLLKDVHHLTGPILSTTG